MYLTTGVWVVAARGVATDRSMYRHPHSRGVQGYAPSENLISYIAAAAIKNILSHILKDFFYILQRLPRRKGYSFLNVNSLQNTLSQR